jgi:hypothetical protein
MKMGEFLAEAIKNKREFPEQMKEIQSHRSFFKRIIEAHKEEWSGGVQILERDGLVIINLGFFVQTGELL